MSDPMDELIRQRESRANEQGIDAHSYLDLGSKKPTAPRNTSVADPVPVETKWHTLGQCNSGNITTLEV
jgi:hypothetical protein